MFCTNCGKEISDKASICIHCGVSTKKEIENIGWSEGAVLFFYILSFFVPIIGVIIGVVGSDKVNAKKILNFSLIMIGINIFLWILLILIAASNA